MSDQGKDKIRVRVTREYAVDVRAWALEYNLSGDFDEVREDIGRYLAGGWSGDGSDFADFHLEADGDVEQTSYLMEFL